MNQIEITANIIKYKKTNDRLWILLKDGIKDRTPTFSANLIGKQVERLSEVIQDGLVVTIDGEVAGVDTDHGTVIIYNPVFIKAYRETKIWDEIMAAGEELQENSEMMAEDCECEESECD